MLMSVHIISQLSIIFKHADSSSIQFSFTQLETKIKPKLKEKAT